MDGSRSFPHFRCNDVVVPPGGAAHDELVAELRRLARRYFEDEQRGHKGGKHARSTTEA